MVPWLHIILNLFSYIVSSGFSVWLALTTYPPGAIFEQNSCGNYNRINDVMIVYNVFFILLYYVFSLAFRKFNIN